MTHASSHHQRLSAVDALLLCMEDATSPMHVAAVLIFDGAPLRSEDGSLQVERLQAHVESRLWNLPRYRQRLDWVPLLEHPVWVDDASFDVRSHVRPVSVPPPGSKEQLEALVGQLVAEPLDRSRPMWEIYLVDGLQDGAFALVAKVHHCIVDGVLGAQVIASTLELEPREDVSEVPAWRPRPAPRPRELLLEEIRYRGLRTADLMRQGRDWLAQGGAHTSEARQMARGLLSYLKALVPASATPFNPHRIGPRRSFHWTTLDLDRVKALKRRAGCTVNDVAMAVVAGAVREYLQRHDRDVGGVDFRVMVPVSEHREGIQPTDGNRVSLMIVRLPVDESDPAERLRRCVEVMREAKGSRQADSLAFAEELADWTTAQFLAEAARRMVLLRPINMIVTNVPGPPMQLYILAAPLREAHAMVPLFGNIGAGIALFSYFGRLGVGINADPDTIPDASILTELVQRAFAELEQSVPVIGEARRRDDGPRSDRPRPRRQ
ncbi:MAG: wax ester/triacylglycerol synthase family O-acyltransferase [Myxococcota bacterium]